MFDLNLSSVIASLWKLSELASHITAMEVPFFFSSFFLALSSGVLQFPFVPYGADIQTDWCRNSPGKMKDDAVFQAAIQYSSCVPGFVLVHPLPTDPKRFGHIESPV